MNQPDSRLRTWLRRFAGAFHIGLGLLAVISISGCLYLLSIFLFDPSGAEEWTVGLRPSQYYADIGADQRVFSDSVYTSVVGVAHNSGGSIEATLEALISGADVIEVDVAEIDGVLYSAHSPPLPFVGQRWFRGPSLARVWAASLGAEAISLDLKDSSPRYVQLVANFLAARSPFRTVIVSSREPQVLRTLRPLVPNAIMLLSIPDARTLTGLQENDSLVNDIDGVTIRHTVLDADNVTWLRENGLLIFAWTVNDLPRANELIGFGIDAITTDNLGIQTLLSGIPENGSRLDPAPSTPPPP